jgi:hypothetical protein
MRSSLSPVLTAPPTEDLLGSSRIPPAILDRRLRLKLPPPKSRQLPGRRLDRLSHRFRQFRQHRLFLETPNSRIFILIRGLLLKPRIAR